MTYKVSLINYYHRRTPGWFQWLKNLAISNHQRQKVLLSRILVFDGFFSSSDEDRCIISRRSRPGIIFLYYEIII